MKHFNFRDRTGEEHLTVQGYSLKIIEYVDANNCTVQFEDNVIVKNVTYNSIKNKHVGHPNHFKNKELGKIYITNENYNVTIIEYFNTNNCTIKFNDKEETILKNVKLCHIKTGSVKNPNKVFLCGVGYLGIGDYKSKGSKIAIKRYNAWNKMLRRCYDENVQVKQPTYLGVTVCEEWYNFQNFAKWFEDNWKPWMDENWQLDKDILIKGNKIYSPETCVFVPIEINNLFKKFKSKENVPTGIGKRGKNFIAYFGAKLRHLGTFNTIEEAFQAYKTRKEQHFKEVADKWRDLIEPRVYQALYNYEAEITN